MTRFWKLLKDYLCGIKHQVTYVNSYDVIKYLKQIDYQPKKGSTQCKQESSSSLE